MSAIVRSTLLAAGLGMLAGCQGEKQFPPFPEARIETSVQLDGVNYFLVDDGNAYREVVPGKSWVYHATVFDPVEVRESYVEEDGKTFRVDRESGRRFEVVREFSEDFEDLPSGAAGLSHLVGEERLRWGSFTLQGPGSPEVKDYVELRGNLLAGSEDFRDCRIEVSQERAHSGRASLACYSAAKPQHMVTCKASLSSPLVYFRNGDDFWFEGHFFAVDQRPLTLMDLESEFIAEHSGIRVRLYEDNTLGVELKALDKPQFRQPENRRVEFPVGKWVAVKVHFKLSPTDGLMEIWQDGVKVLDANGMTLPFRSAIYNSLEIGISAHSDETNDCQLFVDDVRISPSDFDAAE